MEPRTKPLTWWGAWWELGKGVVQTVRDKLQRRGPPVRPQGKPKD